MGWVSATWTRTIITILVAWAVLFAIKVGKEQGWYPEDPSWGPCTTWPEEHDPPCVLDDGTLLANLNGRFAVYPKEGK